MAVSMGPSPSVWMWGTKASVCVREALPGELRWQHVSVSLHLYTMVADISHDIAVGVCHVGCKRYDIIMWNGFSPLLYVYSTMWHAFSFILFVNTYCIKLEFSIFNNQKWLKKTLCWKRKPNLCGANDFTHHTGIWFSLNT